MISLLIIKFLYHLTNKITITMDKILFPVITSNKILAVDTSTQTGSRKRHRWHNCKAKSLVITQSNSKDLSKDPHSPFKPTTARQRPTLSSLMQPIIYLSQTLSFIFFRLLYWNLLLPSSLLKSLRLRYIDPWHSVDSACGVASILFPIEKRFVRSR